MKYHVHVYQVALKGEVDVEADSEDEAKIKSLKLAEKGNLTLSFPEFGKLAIVPQPDRLPEKPKRPPIEDVGETEVDFS